MSAGSGAGRSNEDTMANWVRKLDLSDLFEKSTENGYYGDDALSIPEIAEQTSERLKRIKYTKSDSSDFERMNERIEEIAGWFEDVCNDGEGCEGYNSVLAELYDFGDTPLDNNFGGKKALWIAT